MNLHQFGFRDSHLTKRRALRELGIDPYPYAFDPTHTIQELVEGAEKHVASQTAVRATGRVWARRNLGRLMFLDLSDGETKIQLYVRPDQLPDAARASVDLLDIGDWVGVYGSVIRTRTGELSIDLSDIEILSKTTVPIPLGKESESGVHSRLSDEESRYRERYLTWMLSGEERERMIIRSRIISIIRCWLEGEGFLEVQTPTIEPVYGGAEARPFRTSVWALGGTEAYLRISPELYLKRYIVGGFERVFTICQNFRNEGIDRSHNPEFTMLEWYEAFTDYERQMSRFEQLVAEVCQEIHGTTRIAYQGQELDFAPPWRRVTITDAISEATGVEVDCLDVDALRRILNQYSIDAPEALTWGTAVLTLFESTCERLLLQPTFVLDFPIETSPLTKVKRGDARFVERFEPFVMAMELGNAYSELTDPVDQVERFLAQRAVAREGDDFETHPIDADFIRAVGMGMPPTGGVGLGVDRLVMLLTDAPTIRDVIPFPMYKRR